MRGQFYNYRFYIVLATDLVIFVMAFVGAYLLRFDFALEPFYSAQILRLLPYFLPSKILIFFSFGLYRGMWRYTGLNDLWRLTQATWLAMLLYITIALCIHGFSGIPARYSFLTRFSPYSSGGLRGIRFYYSVTPVPNSVAFHGWSLRSLGQKVNA
jgi:FlaA1/EpsC-like NDP-sugar epimerase